MDVDDIVVGLHQGVRNARYLELFVLESLVSQYRRMSEHSGAVPKIKQDNAIRIEMIRYRREARLQVRIAGLITDDMKQ